MDANHTHQIESYLSGQMSAEEAAKFESLLEVNPELQEELAFQSETIQGIGEFRKAELKARLDALDPSTAWWTIAQLSPVGQFLGGSILVGLLSVGGYFLLSENAGDPGNEITISAPEYIPQPFMLELPDIEPVVQERDQLETVVERVERNDKEVVDKSSFTPVVTVPSAGEVETEKAFVPEELPTPDEVDNQPEIETVDVEIIESRSAKIKYRYYEGKLYLYGKFSDEPYQILEINSYAGRRIFLYHKNAFHTIRQSDKPLLLEQITDTKLIQELKILQKSK